MIDAGEVQRFADSLIAMIKEDQVSGQVPDTVGSVDELDDSVDIEDYINLARIPAADHDAVELRAAVMAEVDRRLKAAHSGPWHVIWKQPDGTAADIGRSAGYLTKTEAQAIGREQVRTYGGRFTLRTL